MELREYDPTTGRPLVDGHEAVEELSDAELEFELEIAALEPRRRAVRLATLLAERQRRRALETSAAAENALV